jgi:hypothetical protein
LGFAERFVSSPLKGDAGANQERKTATGSRRDDAIKEANSGGEGGGKCPEKWVSPFHAAKQAGFRHNAIRDKIMSNKAPFNITQIATQVLISEKGKMKSKGEEMNETKGLDEGELLELEHCFRPCSAHVPKHAAAAGVKKRSRKQLAEMGREGAQSCPPMVQEYQAGSSLVPRANRALSPQMNKFAYKDANLIDKRWQHMIDHTNLEVDMSRSPVKSTLYLVEERGEGRVRNVVGLKEDYKEVVSPLGGWDDDGKSQREGVVSCEPVLLGRNAFSSLGGRKGGKTHKSKMEILHLADRGVCVCVCVCVFPF